MEERKKGPFEAWQTNAVNEMTQNADQWLLSRGEGQQPVRRDGMREQAGVREGKGLNWIPRESEVTCKRVKWTEEREVDYLESSPRNNLSLLF